MIKIKLSTHAAVAALAGCVVLAVLTGCSTVRDVPASAGANGGAAASEAGSLDCDDSATVDQAVCDDLNDATADDPEQPCDFADGSAVWTPAFADFNPDRPVRCAVPGEAELFQAMAGYGAQVDGVSDLGTEGSADYNIFYLMRGSCGGEPTYWPATDSWSRFKGTSPRLTDERFPTGKDVVTAICG
ncbi:hypothetical protein [uncultured Microbacterium sp.]|uniref:hypothetical protein n=1 Tax=uncultured Microbacterium sp. TaxID=191216 RepID=UPI0035CAB5A6